MDFKMLFKLKGLWDKFTKNHPKFSSINQKKCNQLIQPIEKLRIFAT